MDEGPKPIPVPPAAPPDTEVEYLRQIADHLKSIRAMLSFFTFIIVLALILQIFGIVAPMMGP
jgi:hypothetical protein